MRKKLRSICALFGTALLSGCALLPAEEEGRSIALVAEQQAPDYVVEQVQYRDLQNTQTLFATYSYKENENYRFSVSGALGAVCVSAGDTVEEGQLLAYLDTYEDAKEDAARCQEEIERLSGEQEDIWTQMEFRKRYADIKYRYGELTAAEYASAVEQIDSEYSIQLQEIEDALYINGLLLEEAQQCMEESVLIAKQGGAVSEALSKTEFTSTALYEGAYGADAEKEMERILKRMNAVTPDMNVVSVADRGQCAFVCETEYADHFQIGDHVELVMGERTAYSVAVTDIEEQTVYFELTDPDQPVVVGATARYTLVFEGREHVLSISSVALHEMDGGYYVYSVDDAGLRQMQTVEVGVIGDLYAEITGGLEEGDLVIKR